MRHVYFSRERSKNPTFAVCRLQFLRESNFRNTKENSNVYVNPNRRGVSPAFNRGISRHVTRFDQSRFRSTDRTEDDLSLIYDELVHIKALQHLSTMVSIPTNIVISYFVVKGIKA